MACTSFFERSGRTPRVGLSAAQEDDGGHVTPTMVNKHTSNNGARRVFTVARAVVSLRRRTPPLYGVRLLPPAGHKNTDQFGSNSHLQHVLLRIQPAVTATN